jgi:hypothetical protein
MNFLTDKMGQHFWIGANDIDIEDDWIWESDKSKLPIFIISIRLIDMPVTEE